MEIQTILYSYFSFLKEREFYYTLAKYMFVPILGNEEFNFIEKCIIKDFRFNTYGDEEGEKFSIYMSILFDYKNTVKSITFPLYADTNVEQFIEKNNIIGKNKYIQQLENEPRK